MPGPTKMADTLCARQNPERSLSKLGPAEPVHRFVTTGQFSASESGVKPIYPPDWVKRIPDCHCQSKPGPSIYGRMMTFAFFFMDASRF